MTDNVDRGFGKHIAQIVWIGAQVLNWGANIDFFIKVNQKHVNQELNNDLLYFYSIYILFISTIITYPLIYFIGKLCILRKAHFFTQYLLYMIFFCPSYMLVTLLIQQIPQMVITSFYLNEFEFTYSFFQGIITIIIAIWEIYMTTREIKLEEVIVPKSEEQKKMIIGVIKGFNPIIFIFFLTNVVFSHHPLFLYCYWYSQDATILPDQMSLLPAIIILGLYTGFALILQASFLMRRFQEYLFDNQTTADQTEKEMDQDEFEKKMLKTFSKLCGWFCCFFCLYTAVFVVLVIYTIQSFQYVSSLSNVDPVIKTTIMVNFWGFIGILIFNCCLGCILPCVMYGHIKKKLDKLDDLEQGNG